MMNLPTNDQLTFQSGKVDQTTCHLPMKASYGNTSFDKEGTSVESGGYSWIPVACMLWASVWARRNVDDCQMLDG
jgi:hypothetical protein